MNTRYLAFCHSYSNLNFDIKMKIQTSELIGQFIILNECEPVVAASRREGLVYAVYQAPLVFIYHKVDTLQVIAIDSLKCSYENLIAKLPRKYSTL